MLTTTTFEFQHKIQLLTIGDERDDGGILIEDNCDSSPLQKIQYDIPIVEQNRNTRKCIANFGQQLLMFKLK